MTSKISTHKRFTSICFVIFALFFSLSFKLKASEPEENDPVVYENQTVVSTNEHPAEPKKAVDISAIAFEHILDAHSWHLLGEGHDAVAIPLPVILKTDNGIVTFMSSAFHHDTHGRFVFEKNGQRFVNYEETIYLASETANEHGQYLNIEKNDKGETVIANIAPLDFSITKNVTQLFLSAIVLFLLFTSIAKAYKKQGVDSAPKGKQSFLEPLIVFVRDDLAKTNIGPRYEKFVPYLLTVFFLILINNIFGLIPFSANLTGNIAFTLVISVFTFIITNINGNKHYWSHIFLPHAPKAIWPILIPIEVFGILTKPFALMIRLFANIAAGHIIIISLIGLIFIFESIYIAPVSVAFALFIDILEVLVAFLQAYIFTMLSSLFIGAAVADTNEDGAHNEDDGHAVAKH